MLKHEIRIDMVEKLFKPTSSNTILKSALGLLFPVFKKKTVVRNIVSIIPSILLAYVIATNKQTIPILKENVVIMNEVLIAIFGIVFTGYTLFQALIGKEMLLRMLQSIVVEKKEEKSKLQETNELFANVLMLCFINIAVGSLILIIMNCIPDDYFLFKVDVINEIASGIGIFIYFYAFIIILLEVKSFIYNIVQLFNLHAGTRILEILEEEKEKEEKL